jgi:hypothetical protein
MSGRPLWRYLPPPGPILSLALIGLVLLSGLLYYRAVKIQRFLEPALALSQPRNEFAKDISQTVEKEFGAKSAAGIKVKTSAILVEKSRLFSGDGTLRPTAQADLKKLARVCLSLMKDDDTRSNISVVLITARVPLHETRTVFIHEMIKAQQVVGFIQDSLFQAEPELRNRYASFFAGTVQPVSPREGTQDLIELRIIPSEFLHIKVLEKLEKYAF